MEDYLIVVYRTAMAFGTLYLLTRLLGKKQVSHLSFFEYVYGLGAGTIAGSMVASTDKNPWQVLAGLVTWGLLAFILQVIGIRSRSASKVVDSGPTVVIRNGRILEENMAKMRFRYKELMSLLRQKDVFDLAEVEFAVLEPDGRVSVLKKSQFQGLTPADVGIPASYKGLSTELLVDGQVIDTNLDAAHLSRDWLTNELCRQGVRDVRDVAYATLDTSGRLYVDLKDDRKPLPSRR